MDADETDICNYLKAWRGQFVSSTEIARRAGSKARFRKEPAWAVPVLARLVERGILKTDAYGHYCLPRKKKRDESERWVSPQIKKILEQSGKNFEQAEDIEDTEGLEGE